MVAKVAQKFLVNVGIAANTRFTRPAAFPIRLRRNAAGLACRLHHSGMHPQSETIPTPRPRTFNQLDFERSRRLVVLIEKRSERAVYRPMDQTRNSHPETDKPSAYPNLAIGP